jgi:hypothetical protein
VKNTKTHLRTFRALLISALVLAILAVDVSAETWNGLEPFRTRREEVLKILGQPIGESPDGVLRFGVSGGSVQVSFVNEKFVSNKKLKPELAGTVLEIVLQHEHSSATPESLNLLNNKDYIRDEVRNISTFRNVRSGIVYTFIDGSLKTTRYTFSDNQLSHARR